MLNRKKYLFISVLLFSFVFLFSENDDYPKIRSVIIDSNRPLPVEKYIASLSLKSGDKFNQKKANESSEKIKNLLAKDHFYNVKVRWPELHFLSGNRVDVIYKIDFGEKLKIKEITFLGNKYFSDAKLKRFLFGDSEINININQLSENVRDIVRIYADREFLFAKAELDSLISDKDGYRAVIKIFEGEKTNFTDYEFQGNITSKEETLLKISGLNKVGKLTRSALLQIENRVLEKQYIESCELIPLNYSVLLMKIREGKMTKISTLLGYSDNDSKARLMGTVDLKLLNLFGTDRTFGLYWSRPNKYKTKLEINYRDPGFDIVPVGFSVDLGRESSDSLYVGNEAELALIYDQFYYNISLIGGYDSFYPINSGVSVYSETSQKKLGFKGKFDNTDYFLNPRSGNRLYFRFNEIWAVSDNGNYQNEEIFFGIDNFFSLSRYWVTATIFNGKFSKKRDIVDIYQYNLGGNKNLRGFYEDRFHGTGIGWASFELRYLLNFKSRIFIFCDYGYAEYEENGVLYKNDDLIGIGFGFRIDTALGILKLDYAFGHADKTWQNPVNGYIHIGLDTEF